MTETIKTSESNPSSKQEPGQLEGETCHRDGCAGVIEERAPDNCSCHISPPCSACTSPREFCPECDWQATDDEVPFNDYLVRPANPQGAWAGWRPRPLDPSKLDYRSSCHTHASMKKQGVFPYPMTQAEVRTEVDGTFGGRFESFQDATPDAPGRFTFIAYTD